MAHKALLAVPTLLGGLALAACSKGPLPVAAGTLSNQSVTAVVEGFDRAWMQDDRGKAAQYMADDYAANWAYTDDNGVHQVVHKTKQQLLDSHSGATDRQIEGGPLTVLVGDGVAHAKRNVKRMVTFNGKVVSSTEDEDLTLVLRDGRVLILQDDSNTLKNEAEGR